MDMWVIIELVTNVVDAWLLVLILDSFFVRKYKSKLPIVASIVVTFFVLTTLNHLGIGMTYTLVVGLVLCIIIGFLLYSGSLMSRIFIPILLGVFMTVSELLVVVVLRLIFPHVSTPVFLEANQYRLFGIFLSKLLLFLMIKFSGRLSKKENVKLSFKYTLMLLLVPGSSVLLLNAIFQFEFSGEGTSNPPLWLAVSAGCLLGINILVFYLFERISKDFSKLGQYHMMQQQIGILENHLKEMKAAKGETRRIWHDIKNHLTCIRGMVQAKKYDELIRYTDTMTHELGNAIEDVQTGHAVVDALLSAKIAVAKESDIKMDINARIPSGITIESFDISVVLSNAVDNAIEACQRLDKGLERFVEIVVQAKKECLFIVVKNTYDGRIKYADGAYITLKEDSQHHGIGLNNLRETVEKYNGHVKINAEDNVFDLMAIMFFEKEAAQPA